MAEISNYDQPNDELKSCPFCGEKPVWWLVGNAERIGWKRIVVVKCPECGTEQKTSVVHLPTNQACKIAIDKWNQRIIKKN